MASTSAAALNIAMTLTQSGTNAAGGPFWNNTMSFVAAMANGSAAGQVDSCYMAQRSVATGATDTFDCNGANADALGVTIAMLHIVAIFIINAPVSGTANTTTLTVGAGSNPVVGYLGGTTPTIGPIQVGACALLCAPGATSLCSVTAGTGDIITIVNSAGATNNYQIAVLGRSA